MAATTVTVNEVTGCTKDNDEGKARQGKAKGDKGRQRETKGDDTGDSGDEQDGEGREQAASMHIST